MKKPFARHIAITFLGIFMIPFAAQAAALKYAAWLPFWKKQSGAQEIALNLDTFAEISPFSYEVAANGSLIDDLGLDKGFWPSWFSAAHDMNVKIIPTIALLYGNQSYALLSNTSLRQKHENNIAALIKAKNFDGVDIDYEAKPAKERPYFDLFLQGLAMRLHPKGKILSCTIEARTPADSLYTGADITATHVYANDYAVINKYCDEVRIMAYDQTNIDLQLNASKGNGTFYMPVADPAWVDKVLALAVKSISPKKIMLGVPTYGYQYEVTWNSGIATYKRLRAMDFNEAMDLADTVSVAPTRNNAGELSLVFASSTPISVSRGVTFAVNSTTTLPIILASATNAAPTTRFVSFTDAVSIQQKIDLAKKYKLRGVAFFKMDGEADPAIWSELN